MSSIPSGGSRSYQAQRGEKVRISNKTGPTPVEISFEDGTTIELLLIANTEVVMTVGSMSPTVTISASQQQMGDIRSVDT